MTYNLTFLEGAATPLTIAAGVNTAAGGWFGGMILIGFFTLIFIVFKNERIEGLIAADGFLTAILAAFLYIAGLAESWMIGIPAIIAAIGVFIMIWSD